MKTINVYKDMYLTYLDVSLPSDKTILKFLESKGFKSIGRLSKNSKKKFKEQYLIFFLDKKIIKEISEQI